MHVLVMLMVIGSLLTLAGCTEMGACKAYPVGSAAYKTCVNAVLQHQSARQDRQLRLDFRGRQ